MGAVKFGELNEIKAITNANHYILKSLCSKEEFILKFGLK